VEKKINYRRAAMLKALLLRNFKKEVPVSLDEKKTDRAYLIGRLFAVLEKIQMASQGGLNKSLRERFFSAVSTTPACVLLEVQKLSDHHLSKLPKPSKIYFEKMIGSILENVDRIPECFLLEEQAEFMLGYYHQRNSLFKSRKEDVVTEE
jgi:CRISPR-associated protein Csd1